MKDNTTRSKATVGTSVLFALVALAAMFVATPSASAQGTTVTLAQVGIGGINVSWHGTESIGDSHMTLDDMLVTGGDPDTPIVDLLSHVDLYTLGSHLQLLLLSVFLKNSTCMVNFHGALLFIYVGDDLYENFFNKNELGGILYANCSTAEQGLILTTLGSGVSARFHIPH